MEITCPYCFETFDSKEIMLRCRNPHCEDDDDNYYEYWKDIDQNVTKTQRHVYYPRHRFLRKDDTSCDKCGGKNYDYVCPHCHNELPGKMIEEGAEIISVIGGPGSGKTHYIVALLQELRKTGHQIGLDATLLQVGDNTKFHTEELFKKQIDMLNKQNQVLDQTRKEAPQIPWIVRIDSTDPRVRGQQVPKKSIYLVFYDTAGEHFNNRKTIEQNAKYLSQSKAVIVLFDTLSIPQIKSFLKQDVKASSFEDTWEALKNFIGEGKNNELSNEQLKQKPFAFVMSKFDVVLANTKRLQFLPQGFLDENDIPLDNSYKGKPRDQRAFDLSTVTNSHESIADALERWDDNGYPDKVDKWWGDNARFFGMSALGAMPNEAGEIPEGGIKPWRVMDPLLWIMYRIGGFAFETIG